MKKILAAVLVLLMLASGTIAYAAPGNGQSGMSNGHGGEMKDSDSDQQHRNRMRETAKLAKSTNSQLNELRDEVRDKLHQIRDEIRLLKQDPESLTEEEISEIREKLELLGDDRAQLAGTHGLIRGETLRLRLYKRTKDLAGAAQCFDKIYEIQEERIKALKELSSDLDELLKLL